MVGRYRAGNGVVDQRRGAEGDSREPERPGVVPMAPTRYFKQTIVERVRRDPEFAKAFLDEATTLFLDGEPHTARVILRALVNATVGSEETAAETAKPAKSL